MRHRFLAVLRLLTAGFLIVAVRLAYVQLWRHAELSRRAENQSARRIQDSPRRVDILDRNGRPLAQSVRSASCYADPRSLASTEQAARRLGAVLSVDPAVLRRKIKDAPGAFVWLKRGLTMTEVQDVEGLKLKGVGLQWDYRRDYPEGSLAAPVLGFVGGDGRGLSGLEHEFDESLIDRGSSRLYVRDGRGARLSLESMDPPSARGGLRLSLDRTIQYIAERELERGMQRSRAKSGVIVVQDPHTGEILAMANRPAKSLNDVARLNPSDLTIPAAQWVFEPGSTFKVVTAAAAFEEGLVRSQETFDCERGRWKFADIVINDHEPEGVLTFARAMEVSSNIGLAKVGLRLGKERFYDYVRAFGFGSRASGEIPGESAGILRVPRRWSAVSLPILSFGQEVGVTALQLAGAYSVLANGGWLMEPRLCLSLEDASGRRREWPTPARVRRVVTAENAAAVTRLLEGVVERGTGRDAALDGWFVAGKTGTAQKIDARTRAYSPEHYVASFCGFAPSRRPRLTIVVVFDEPKGIAWGGYNAGPVFRNVAAHADRKSVV
jgi:cell division protein FtsI (penicillin-binding protein 3)